MFLHIYRICPGSGFVSLHTDPDPTFIIQIRIHKSGSATLVTYLVLPRSLTDWSWASCPRWTGGYTWPARSSRRPCRPLKRTLLSGTVLVSVPDPLDPYNFPGSGSISNVGLDPYKIIRIRIHQKVRYRFEIENKS